jgi:hypothetical protein
MISSLSIPIDPSFLPFFIPFSFFPSIFFFLSALLRRLPPLAVVEQVWASGLVDTLGNLLRAASSELAWAAGDVCVMLAACASVHRLPALAKLRVPSGMLKAAAHQLETPGGAETTRQILGSLLSLCSLGAQSLVPGVLADASLLQMLLTDDPVAAQTALVFLRDLLRHYPALLASVDQTRLLELLDELTFKLTQQTDLGVAEQAFTCLYLLLQNGPPALLTHTQQHYAPLPRTLERLWGHTLGRLVVDVNALLAVRDQQREHDRNLRLQHQAAARIQAGWRGKLERDRCAHQVEKAKTNKKKTGAP